MKVNFFEENNGLLVCIFIYVCILVWMNKFKLIILLICYVNSLRYWGMIMNNVIFSYDFNFRYWSICIYLICLWVSYMLEGIELYIY